MKTEEVREEIERAVGELYEKSLVSALDEWMKKEADDMRDELIKMINTASDDMVRQICEMFPVEPEIPEGFERWPGGECPVPGDCDVEVMYLDGSVNAILRAEVFAWVHDGDSYSDIIAYRVTHVPTLTEDDEVDGYWFVTRSGLTVKYGIAQASEYSIIISCMAYRTFEHAETAKKWGLLHDVYYTKMGFEKPKEIK